MILETQEQARATPHKEGVSFRCSVCGEVKPVQTSGGTGYGYNESNEIVCYACCGDSDRARMKNEGKITLYLAGDLRPHSAFSMGHCEVVNWPGTLRFKAAFRRGRHNIARYRYDVWFWGPDGYRWHGVTYGENTSLCHCKRTKEKSA